MYLIEWDKETGGVVLTSRVTKDTLGISPRPVFFEELDLLDLEKKGWIYPHSKAPIMWAVNKQYWYHGRLLFEAKGANIYTSPTLMFTEGVKPTTLHPIDIDKMLKRTSDLMFVLENEAVEFIRDIYTEYTKANNTYNKADANKLDFEAIANKLEKTNKIKQAIVSQDCDSFDIIPLNIAESEGKKILLSTKIDRFIASFSGGKDSQVVLDLCTRAIPPTNFEVIYSDTGYELPPSLSLFGEIKDYYKQKFPALKFTMVRNHESVLNYWDKIGTPSDTHRWCCSIMKTVPLYRMLKQGHRKNAKFLAFEGVRAEESAKRSNYNRIGKGVKHSFVINARPILRWNTTEVFLYLFRHQLPINDAYRCGKPRVGCILCPFGSPWDDMIVNKCYPKNLHPFLTKIENIVRERGIPNGSEYISDRRWKLRGSGKFSQSKTFIQYVISSNRWEVKVKNSQKEIFTWFPTIGTYSINGKNNIIKGELLFEKEIYRFEIQYRENKLSYSFILYDNNNIQLRYLLRRIINKTTYCINCESCELECPTGALSVYPEITINKELCTHCHRCLEYHNAGCIVADSMLNSTNINISNMKISKYGTFGIHQEWIEQYLSSPSSFFSDNILGVKQIPSFKAWLKDAEIIDDKNCITPFGLMCIEINKNSSSLLWELIYINLTYNSPLVRWYITTFSYMTEFSRKNIDKYAIEYFQHTFKETTITYAIQALMQTFKYSPIGEEFFQCVAQDEKGNMFKREVYMDLSPEAIAYSAYKYAYFNGFKMFRVSDLYRSDELYGIYKEFGIDKNELMKRLRYLSSGKNRVLIAELNMGLDHITIRDDLNPVLALKTLID